MLEQSNNYLNHLFGLEGKTILVTGACGQLGGIICQGFLDAESVVIAVDLNLDQKNVIQDDNISYRSLDIASKHSVRLFLDEIYKRRNSIDVLINNAGLAHLNPLKIGQKNRLTGFQTSI